MNNNQSQKNVIQDVFYKTKELTFFQKLMQVYWFNPKKWLLDEFSLTSNRLKVITKNGTCFEAPLDKISGTYSLDKYNRHEIKLKDDQGNKICFKEIPYMLEDEEWENILEILPLNQSKFNKIIKVISGVTSKVDDLL